MNVKNIKQMIDYIQLQQDINSTLVTIAQNESIPAEIRLEINEMVIKSTDNVITPMLNNIQAQLEIAKLQIEVDSFMNGILP